MEETPFLFIFSSILLNPAPGNFAPWAAVGTTVVAQPSVAGDSEGGGPSFLSEQLWPQDSKATAALLSVCPATTWP